MVAEHRTEQAKTRHVEDSPAFDWGLVHLNAKSETTGSSGPEHGHKK